MEDIAAQTDAKGHELVGPRPLVEVAREGQVVDRAKPFSPTDPARLARGILRSWGAMETSVRFWKGRFWEWNRLSYDEVTDEDMRARVQRMLQTHYQGNVRLKSGEVMPLRPAQVTAVLESLKAEVLVPANIDVPVWLDSQGRVSREHVDAYGYIALTNGIMGLSAVLDGQTTPLSLSPRFFSRVVLPYEFDSAATCPRFESFIAEIMEGDQERIGFLQEFAGYCLIPETRFHTFVVLEGPGANGKSVLLSVLINLLGDQNVSYVPLERFADRFALASTIGKLANVVNEAESVPNGVTGVLKQFVAGDRMTLDLKFKTPIDVTPTAKLVIASNTRLNFSDSSEGLWRRMVVIPCTKVIPKAEQDAALTDKLLDELPGIFNWAIAGLQRLLERGQFIVPTASKNALEEYQVETNSARLFLQEHYVEGAGELDAGPLYERYKAYCEEEGEKAVRNNEFGKEVFRVFSKVKKGRQPSGARKYFYEGLIAA